MKRNIESDEVRKIFKNRCIICQKLAKDVHEIVPRSQTKEWKLEENRVLLCRNCHFLVHDSGAKNYSLLLKGKRKERLITYYGTESLKTIRELLFN